MVGVGTALAAEVLGTHRATDSVLAHMLSGVTLDRLVIIPLDVVEDIALDKGDIVSTVAVNENFLIPHRHLELLEHKGLISFGA
jgi:hypothetical protein